METKSKSFLFKPLTIVLSVCLIAIIFLLVYQYSSHRGLFVIHSQPAEIKNTAIQLQPEAPNTFLNVTKIAKKPKTFVDSYLGPSSNHKTVSPSNAPCPCEQYDYKDGNIVIVFMNDKADWITAYHMNSVLFKPANILEALGIAFANPVIMDNDVIKWNDYYGYDQLSAFSDGKGGVSYIFLKAITH